MANLTKPTNPKKQQQQQQKKKKTKKKEYVPVNNIFFLSSESWNQGGIFRTFPAFQISEGFLILWQGL